VKRSTAPQGEVHRGTEIQGEVVSSRFGFDTKQVQYGGFVRLSIPFASV